MREEECSGGRTWSMEGLWRPADHCLGPGGVLVPPVGRPVLAVQLQRAQVRPGKVRLEARG